MISEFWKSLVLLFFEGSRPDLATLWQHFVIACGKWKSSYRSSKYKTCRGDAFSSKRLQASPLFLFFPMFQLRKVQIKLSAPFPILQTVRVWHMFNKIIQQRFFCLIRKSTVWIAPLAIILVPFSIWLFAHHRIFKRHSAALTDQFSRRTQQGIDRHRKQAWQQF